MNLIIDPDVQITQEDLNADESHPSLTIAIVSWSCARYLAPSLYLQTTSGRSSCQRGLPPLPRTAWLSEEIMAVVLRATLVLNLKVE